MSADDELMSDDVAGPYVPAAEQAAKVLAERRKWLLEQIDGQQLRRAQANAVIHDLRAELADVERMLNARTPRKRTRRKAGGEQ